MMRCNQTGLVDCLPTCIECILELPLGTLPRPVDDDMDTQARWLEYYERLRQSLRLLNVWLIEVMGYDDAGKPVTPPGWAVGGFSKPHPLEDDGRLHALVCYDSVPVHDPHPEFRQAVALEDWGEAQCWDMLGVLDPMKPVGRPVDGSS